MVNQTIKEQVTKVLKALQSKPYGVSYSVLATITNLDAGDLRNILSGLQAQNIIFRREIGGLARYYLKR